MPTLDREFVSTMADIRVRAEFLAKLTEDAYHDAARHAPNLSPSDRSKMFAASSDYRRRRERVSRYCARFA